MSTESNRKWARVDKRMAEARKLLGMWETGEREACDAVLARARSVQVLAAIVHATDPTMSPRPGWGHAAFEICEVIARERN